MRRTTHSDGSTTVTTNVFNTVVSAEAGDKLEVVLTGQDGKPVPSIPAEAFDDGIARSYKGFYGILDDLNDAAKALAAIQSLAQGSAPIVSHSLLVNAVVSYGRCFASAEGRGGVTLQASHPWVNKNSDEIRWHDTLMDLRHKFFAHAGVSPFRSAFALVLVDSQDQPTMIHGIYTGKFELSIFGPDDTKNCGVYLDSLIKRVAEKVDQLAGKLQQKANNRIKEQSC